MLDILPNSGDIAPLSPLLWRYSLVTRSGEPSSPRMPSQSVIGVFSDQFNDALPARVSRASSSASQSEISPVLAESTTAPPPAQSWLTSATMMITVMVAVARDGSVAVTSTVYLEFVPASTSAFVISCPLDASMSKDAASTPPSVYVSTSSFASEASIGVPMLVPAVAFSATERVVLSPSVNSGGTLVMTC